VSEPTRSETEEAHTSLETRALDLLGSIWALVDNFLGLVGSEARLAGLTMAAMAAAAMAAMVMLISAWLFLQAAFLLWLVHNGTSWTTGLVALAAANVCAGLALAAWVKHASRRLSFPATRSALKPQAQK